MPRSSVITSVEDEVTCPVCFEPLSYRLAGEKPHVVPSCGHQLHNVCFESVYGPVARAKSRGVSVGLCGICRKDMKIGDDFGGGGSTSKRNKLAALHGDMGQDSHKMRSVSRRTIDKDDDDFGPDEQEDDDLVQLPLVFSSHHAHSQGGGSAGGRTSTTSSGATVNSDRRGSDGTARAFGGGTSSQRSSTGSGGPAAASEGQVPIVRPIIIVRAEHSSMPRSSERDQKQHLTCMVTIEMPPRWQLPQQQQREEQHRQHLHHQHHHHQQQQYGSGSSPQSSRRPGSEDSHGQSPRPGLEQHQSPPPPPRPSSPSGSSVYSAYAYGSTGAASGSDPLAAIVADLRERMSDWKGHSPEEFGALKLHENLAVRKDKSVREFIVYLFEEAILCVSDDKRRGIAGKIVESVSGSQDKLRLKGRVYARHISRVLDTSQDAELSLTIKMSDDALDEFIMQFKDRSTLDTWKTQINDIVAAHNTQANLPPPPPPPAPSSGMSRSRPNTGSNSIESNYDSDYASERSVAHSSAFSGYTRTTTSSNPISSIIHEEGSSDSQCYPVSPYDMSVHHRPSSGSQLPPPPSVRLRSHTPLDLMLIMSVPLSGANHLKLNIIRSTLDFIVHNVGPRTRISLVTYSTGDGIHGSLHKTPFIAVGTDEGRSRLEAAIGEVGSRSFDNVALVEHKEDRVNVVTAVNLALDIVLQRKAKSALTGIVLVNDGKDGAQKAQMDLVKIRAEAANVPIHCIGWGRSHDPSTLWLLSDHTGGTYTHCKEFYDLKDTVAGLVGGLLSIAATSINLHISVPERRWFRIRKVAGGPKAAVVSSDGKDADIRIADLRFGERRDLLVEIEMTGGDYSEKLQRPQQKHQPRTQEFTSATDAFFLSRVGLNPASLEETSFCEDEYDGMPDEVPLFEVNAAYRDPAANKTVSRLKQTPSLLTITLVPPSPPGSLSPPPPSTSGAPEIIRRRVELLSADMIARTLLLLSRRNNDKQAAQLLMETRSIIAKTKRIIASIASSQPQNPVSNRARSSFLSAQSVAFATLAACDEDVANLLEGCQNRDAFDGYYRFMAAQHAVVLREQRAWTGRTAIERLFWTSDNSRLMVEAGQNWVSSRSD